MGQKSKFLEIATTTPIPSPLYHYTSSAGLLGILETKKIWATKIHYLNDSSELSLGLKYIRQEINSQKEGENSTRRVQELDELLDVLLALEGINIGVVSFTANGDQLSQWRGYSKIGNGYSLGFDGEKVNDQVLGKEGYLFIPCIYNEEDHKLLAKELVDYGRVVGHSQRDKAESSPFHAMEFKRAVLLVASMIKSKAFKEEEEWRLVTPPMNYSVANFRQGSFSLLPYWEYDIALNDTLKQIIIGPTPERQLSYNAIQGALIKHYSMGFTKIKITHSEIPYRSA